jgi:oligopeptide/dipeptide ABC transporter ATP-binding protein
MTALLEVKDLRTHFLTKEETVKAVNGVSFEVFPGETFGLVGESGCGKSVTCRSILRLLRPPGKIISGSVIYDGIDLISLSEEKMRQIRGRKIGMVFQEPMTALNPVLTIKEQIYEAFEDKGFTNDEKRDRAIDALRLVGIPSPEVRLGEYAHQFSGGMRQRAMIAIALAAEPRILLADELTTALDVTIQDQIMKLLNRLRQQLGMSIVLVTHDLGVVAQMCDRLAVMYAGFVMEVCDVVTLFSSPRHPYTYGLLCSLPHGRDTGSKLQSIGGAPPDLGALPPGCPFVPRCQFRERKCVSSLPELQEVTPGHFSRCHFLEKMEGIPGIIDSEDLQQ